MHQLGRMQLKSKTDPDPEDGTDDLPNNCKHERVVRRRRFSLRGERAEKAVQDVESELLAAVIDRSLSMSILHLNIDPLLLLARSVPSFYTAAKLYMISRSAGYVHARRRVKGLTYACMAIGNGTIMHDALDHMYLLYVSTGAPATRRHGPNNEIKVEDRHGQ